MSEMELFKRLVNGESLMRADQSTCPKSTKWEVLELLPTGCFMISDRLTGASRTPYKEELQLEKWAPCDEARFSSSNPEWVCDSIHFLRCSHLCQQGTNASLTARIYALEEKLKEGKS